MTITASTTMAELENRVVDLEAKAAQVQQELEGARMDVRMQRAREQIERGECHTADEVFDYLCKKYNLPRRRANAT